MTSGPGEAFRLLWVLAADPARDLNACARLEPLRELRARGWTAIMAAVSDRPGRQSVHGVEILGVPRRDVYILRNFTFHARVASLLLRRWDDFDVVMAHPISAPWILPFRWLRRVRGGRGPAFVMDTRTLPMVRSTRRDRLRARYHRWIDRAARRWFDGQTSITRGMAAATGVPGRQLLGTWPSGARVEDFVAARAARRWPGPGDPIRIAYVGALAPGRNLEALAAAVAIANARGAGIELDLLGRGRSFETLRRAAAEGDGSVRVLPEIPHDRVWEALARAHVGAAPFPDELKFRVSSPIKIFEYMAAGLPMLLTRIDAHLEAAGDRDFAFWAGTADAAGLAEAMVRIRRERESLPRRGAAAAAASEDWTWRAAAAKLGDALALAVVRRRARPAVRPGPAGLPGGAP